MTTSKAKFLQIHTLHTYSAALLNRDDANLAKTLSYAGHVRTRISSQCLKRHWRTADDEWALSNIPGLMPAWRSRDTVERRILPTLEVSGVSPDVVTAVTDALNVGLYGDKGAQRKDRQPLLLGHPEIRWVAEQAQKVIDQFPEDVKQAAAGVQDLFKASGEQGRNLRAFRQSTQLAGGLESALFGRMVTADVHANTDGAIHVAHALTVHEAEREQDYFSVVDDLTTGDEGSSAHIGTSELTSGIFYGFVAVDLATLVSNLEGVPPKAYDDTPSELAATVLEHLIHLVAKVTPGAKKGSTAPYSHADFILTEIGSRQPRSLMGAFQKPSAPDVESALRALASHLDNFDQAYGSEEERFYLATAGGFEPQAAPATRLSINDLTSRSTAFLAR